MTEFKIGDRVRVIDYQYHSERDEFVGKTGTITASANPDPYWYVKMDVKMDNEVSTWGFLPSELELIQDPRDAALDEIREAWYSLPWEKALDKIDDILVSVGR